MALRSFNNPQARFLDFFSKTGTDASNEYAEASGIVATGGVISDYTSPPGAVYRAHVFTSSGTFAVSSIGDYGSTVEYLVVAGGGGGGSTGNGGGGRGGGGAGGFRTNLSGHPLAGSSFPVSTSPGSYSVSVGAGGAGGGLNANLSGSKGTDSVFSTITSTGGGGGGYSGDPNYSSVKNGGSGGGAYDSSGAGSGNTPSVSPPQGNPAGAGASVPQPGSSGGGQGGGGGGNKPRESAR